MFMLTFLLLEPTLLVLLPELLTLLVLFPTLRLLVAGLFTAGLVAAGLVAGLAPVEGLAPVAGLLVCAANSCRDNNEEKTANMNSAFAAPNDLMLFIIFIFYFLRN
jgi:hypothetical protein